MAELSSLEKYAQGIPLNDELAEMRAGVERASAEADPSPVAQDDKLRWGAQRDVDEELTRTERLDLKELRVSQGWTVLLRLQEKALQQHRRSAISASSSDPLSNRDLIANAWAYVNAYQRAQQELPRLVDGELKLLNEGTK